MTPAAAYALITSEVAALVRRASDNDPDRSAMVDATLARAGVGT